MIARHRGEPPPAETTADLIALTRQGDARARDRLFARIRPNLLRIGHRWLPVAARGEGDTEDLVQKTLQKAFQHLEGFEHRGQGSFLAYLVKVMRNEFLDVMRKMNRRPPREEVGEDLPDPRPLPEDVVITRESLERYATALATLPTRAQDSIVLRIELGLSYQEIALETDAVSAEAARQTIKRGLKTLGERMKLERT